MGSIAQVVLHARYGVGLVMIHVAGGDDEDGLSLLGDDICEGEAELLKRFELLRCRERWERT